jgi:hypothetical protein
MPEPDINGAVRHAIAAFSPTAHAEDLRGNESLLDAQVAKEDFLDLARILRNSLRSKNVSATPLPDFAERLGLQAGSTVDEIATGVRGLIQVCGDVNPGPTPTKADCTRFFFNSYLCRIQIAFANWAEQVPPGGIQMESTMLSLRQTFNELDCALLIKAIRNADVFSPAGVAAANVCDELTGSSTVKDVACAVWSASREVPCVQALACPL